MVNRNTRPLDCAPCRMLIIQRRMAAGVGMTVLFAHCNGLPCKYDKQLLKGSAVDDNPRAAAYDGRLDSLGKRYRATTSLSSLQ